MTIGKTKLNFSGKIATVLLVVIVCFSGWAGYTSYRYDLPFVDVAKNSAKYVALTAVSLGVSVYDPTAEETTPKKLGPPDTKELNISFVRIEEYLADAKQQGLELIEAQNEKIIYSNYDFFYQPDVPRLREIRERMGLDKIVAGAADDLEKMVRLRQWVREQFSRTDYQKKMNMFDALTVWEDPQKNPSKRSAIMGAEYMPCHFFPLFYSQVMLSMGYNARAVHVSTSGYGFHGFTEVWSNQYGKWVSMDPDLNLHYIREGIPLSMLEIHDARYDTQKKPLKVVQVIVEPGNQPKETPEDMIGYHRYIEIADLRNDWLTNGYFQGHPKRSDLATLTWEDDREPDIFRLTPSTKIVADMYWTLNQAEIHVQPEETSQNTLELVFSTVTPNFSHFVVHINGKTLKKQSSTFAWTLQEGRNELTVYPVNSFGVKGISSRIVLRCE